MHIKNIAAMLALLPAMASAQTVASPDGNVSLTFSLTDNGRPTYEMSYKGKKVINPSHLGLELARDKHASKGMEETDLMDGFKETTSKTSTFDETWTPVWSQTKTTAQLDFIVLKDFDIVHIDKIAFLNTKETEWLDFFG